jgi:predicted outer membrane lipoprotein
MPEVYLLKDGEQRGPYSAEQMQAMYLAGNVTSDAFYWQEGLTEWLPVENLFSALKSAPPTETIVDIRAAKSVVRTLDSDYASSEALKVFETSKGKSGRFLLGLVLIAAAFGIGFALLRQHTEKATDTATDEVSQRIPVEIVQALNNVDSAVETGITQDDYASRVIGLKSAVATYGQSLASHQADVLRKLISNYDAANEIWKIGNGNEGIVVLDRGGIRDDSALVRALNALQVPYDKNTSDNGTVFLGKVYSMNVALSALWGANKVLIKELK